MKEMKLAEVGEKGSLDGMDGCDGIVTRSWIHVCDVDLIHCYIREKVPGSYLE